MVKKIFRKFYIKFKESWRKICGISKSFEVKTLQLSNLDQVEITEINILKKF